MSDAADSTLNALKALIAALLRQCPKWDGKPLTLDVGQTFAEGSQVRDFYSGNIQETGAGSDYPLCRLSGADPRTCGVFGTGKCPARERFGSDNQNKRFETVPVSAVKAIS